MFLYEPVCPLLTHSDTLFTLKVVFSSQQMDVVFCCRLSLFFGRQTFCLFICLSVHSVSICIFFVSLFANYFVPSYFDPNAVLCRLWSGFNFGGSDPDPR